MGLWLLFRLLQMSLDYANEFYYQIKRTVMDTIFTLTNAVLSMGYFEIKLCSASTFKYGELLVEYIKEIWKIFLDDCYTALRSSQISVITQFELS